MKEVKRDYQARDGSRSPHSFSPESDGNFVRRSKRLKNSHRENVRVEEEVDDEESDVEEEEQVVEASEDRRAELPSQEGLSGMEFLLGDLYLPTAKSKQDSVEESVDVEVSVYRSSKTTFLGVDPLQWWSEKAAQFPHLATVAQAYLAVPAVAGNAVQNFLQEDVGSVYKKRNNVPPENLDSILFLHHNHMFNRLHTDSK